MNYDTSYKNLKISKEIKPYIKNMESAQQYLEDLQLLSKSWDNLTIMGQLGKSSVDMEKTKKSFANLTQELINHLCIETLQKTSQQMRAKAQTAVDIVIRNLFERTADIGFLATDDDIRDFLSSTTSKYDSKFDENMIHIKNRFKEYVQKYSVYFDIVLMDTKGHILVNLDDDIDISRSKDSIIQEVLHCSDEYVETYKKHDFVPKLENSLVYSYKVTQSDDKNSQTIGILSLCFKFENEMEGIFKNLTDKNSQECILILDKDSKVISSSDIYHIPLGAKMKTVLSQNQKIVSFAGRYYISKTCKTNGYQGFMGLGWMGHIMIPLEYAFLDIEDDSIKIDDNLLQAILQNGENFSKQLKQIPLQANQIQDELNRAVWNGNLSQAKNSSNDKSFSRILLNEISKTGEQTKQIFNSSIVNLTKTIILNDASAISSLMIDIMDRNLYERANDCRWWAITTSFRKTLDSNSIDDKQKEILSQKLKYINDLYTVYTNLFIYDKFGVIVAVSNESQKNLIGKRLSAPWVEKTLHIRSSSKYCVSDFEKTELYDNKNTYIYNASIKSLENPNEINGGIGIVFDSEVEFEAMINESMPRSADGQIKDGVFGIFASKSKTIIASNNENFKVGEYLDLKDSYFELKNGESLNKIITLNGKYYAMSVKCSQGYREYKSSSDDYKNDVYSFFFSYICESNISIKTNEFKKDFNSPLKYPCKDCHEIATFKIGAKYLGAYAKDVVCALSIKDLESSIALDDEQHFKGTVIYNQMAVSVLDIKSFIKETTNEPYNEIIIINYENSEQNHFVGLLVNSLDDIIDVPKSSIKELEQHILNGGTLIKSVAAIEHNSSNQLLTILDIKKLADELSC